MTDIAWLLAVLLGAPSPERPMSKLLALDEEAFDRRARGGRRLVGAGSNDSDSGPTGERVGVSA